MPTNVISGTLVVNGTIQPQAISYPSGSITDTAVNQSAYIQASKMQHRHALKDELFGSAVTITALTKLAYIVRGATATVDTVKAAVVTVATGADRTVDVDVKRSTGGGAFATILTSTAHFTNGSTNLVPVSGTVNNGALVAGDLLEIVVTVAGAAGAQALGLLVVIGLVEDPA